MITKESALSVKLIGVPYHVPGIRGRDLTPGTVLVWNGNYTSTVVRVIPSASGKTMTLITRDDKTGHEYTRKTTPDRVFAFRPVSGGEI